MDAGSSLIPFRLTEPQKRHLGELIGPDGRTLYWRPANSGEERCAQKLREYGLLEGSFLSYSDGYCLSTRGILVAKALLAAEDYRVV